MCRSPDFWRKTMISDLNLTTVNIEDEMNVDNVKIVARIAAELGVDIVKTNWTGDPESC